MLGSAKEPERQKLVGTADAKVLEGTGDDLEEFETEFSDVASDRQAMEKASAALDHIGGRTGELAVSIAGTAGTVNDAAANLSGQADSFSAISVAIDQLSNTNAQISDVLGDAHDVASQVHEGLSESTASVENIFVSSTADVEKLSASSAAVAEELETVSSSITQVYGFSEAIQKIATETQMLAINAGIMAARAGDEGKGFAIIAESIRELSMQTNSVSKDMITQLGSLRKTVDDLAKHGQTNQQIATEAKSRSDSMDAEFSKFREFGKQVDALTNSITDLEKPVADNAQICGRVVGQMHELNQEVQSNAAALKDTSEQFETLVTFSEEMVCLIEESGVETEDSALIRACIETANQVARLFEKAVERGTISIEDLFDEVYEPLPSTDPVQVVTRFTDFTDRVMPDIQEDFLTRDERVAFAAAVDRNGYLPTHNKIYSKPQTSDPVWNAANCRNRRIFNDRTGLAAGRNQKPFYLQTYRRDMGGGNFVLMKDLSAPIYVTGRHWGGFRVGFKVA